MTPSALLSIFQIVISAASGLNAVRLYDSRLYLRYPALFSFMVFLAIYAPAPVIMDTHGKMYFWTWIGSQPVLWLLEILLVRELCRVFLEKFQGLVTLGRWMMYGAVALASFLSLLSLLPHIQSAMPARSKVLGYWVAAGRGITLSLAIFLLLMLFAVSRYPVRLNRNAVLNAVLFTLCFLSDSFGAILKTVFDRRLNPSIAVALSGVEASCLVLWLFFLTPEGEQSQLNWIHFGRDYEVRALARLEALNRILLRRS